MRTVRTLMGAVCVSLLGLVASCSLDLDESLLRSASDGGLVEAAAPDARAPDGAAPDATGPGVPGACTIDADCTTTDPCLVGRCEVARQACIFDVCKPAACTVGTCDRSGPACGATAPYKLAASKFDVGAPSSTRDAFTAVHPYVFVGTTRGVVAFDVSNPSASPRSVPVTGLGFVPTTFVLSGRRIYFVGMATGGAPSRLPLAWLDVPSLPFAPSLAASTVLATYAIPQTPKIFARTGGSGLLVGQAAFGQAATIVEAPLVEPLVLDAGAQPVRPGASAVGVSGDRLVLLSGGTPPSLAVVEGAGGPNPSDGGTSDFVDAGPFLPASGFGGYADGALAWAVATFATGAGPGGPYVRALQLGFPLTGSASPLAAGPFVDVEVYAEGAVPPGSDVVGPVAFVDATRVMVTAGATESIGQTSVQFVDRMTVSVVKSRRALLPIAPATLMGAAGSNGIGYLLANETGPNGQTSAVYVFDPACEP